MEGASSPGVVASAPVAPADHGPRRGPDPSTRLRAGRRLAGRGRPAHPGPRRRHPVRPAARTTGSARTRTPRTRPARRRSSGASTRSASPATRRRTSSAGSTRASSSRPSRTTRSTTSTPSGVIERPKVVYNAKTKKYVMWLHVDSADYKKASAGVAVADRPTGPYRYLGSVRPDGGESRDMTLFQDDDGKAYLVYSSEWNATMHVSLLSDDYLKPVGKVVRIFEGQYREAPAVFKRKGLYYIVTSGLHGLVPEPRPLRDRAEDHRPLDGPGQPARRPGRRVDVLRAEHVRPAGGREARRLRPDARPLEEHEPARLALPLAAHPVRGRADGRPSGGTAGTSRSSTRPARRPPPPRGSPRSGSATRRRSSSTATRSPSRTSTRPTSRRSFSPASPGRSSRPSTSAGAATRPRAATSASPATSRRSSRRSCS